MTKQNQRKRLDRKSDPTDFHKRVSNFRQELQRAGNAHICDLQKKRPEPTQNKTTKKADEKDISIGIVGGGMAGMYASLLLSELNIKHSIYEASGERLGGRVFTYYFNDKLHQYAELGAMRFPNNKLQSRLLNFWKYLNETATSEPGAKEIVKIPYVLFDDNPEPKAGNLLCFNNQKPVTRNEAEKDNGLLGFDQFFIDSKWDYFKDENGKLKPAQELLDAAINPFIELFEEQGISLAWDELQIFNSYSGRSYLQQVGDGVRPYPVEIVDYLETYSSYTGIYDLSFIELVLDTYSFDTSDEWFAMDGGTTRLTQEMLNRIPVDRYLTGKKIVKVDEEGGKANLYYNCGEGTPVEGSSHDRVIITLPFSVLRFVDTPNSWSAGKYQAIRSLKTTNAVKVSLGFNSRFWETTGPYSQGMEGGQSNTDLPSRSIVYPSFGIGEPGPAYILSSYSWQDDADKFGHLTEQQMFTATLRDVATLHGEVAYKEYLGHGASIVWNNDQLAGGGFAFFAEGQFGEMFVNAREPEGLFHFAGEHLDMVHYWIAGSFNSAFRTVWEALILEKLDTKENLKILFNALGGGDILPTMIPRFNKHPAHLIEAWQKEVEAA